MCINDDERPDAPCVACGAQADTRCDWGYEPVHGVPCARPLCFACVVDTMDDGGGADCWCPEHAELAIQDGRCWRVQRGTAPVATMTGRTE
jgi:hypothetical protein